MTSRFFLVARYRLRKNDFPEPSFLQKNGSFGAKETAERFVSTTAAGRAMEKLSVGEDALGVVQVSK